MKGVLNIADDIIVIGRGKLCKQPLSIMTELLGRLTQHNLKLNPDKIKFKSQVAPFMGHTLTPKGLKPSEQIATAILNMPQSQDKTATRRFVGTNNYLSKFYPHLSHVIRPLRDFTHVK